MRIRFLILLTATVLCAGGATYFFSSGVHRRYASDISKLIPERACRFLRRHGFVFKPGKMHAKKRPGRSLIENNLLDRLALLEVADSSVSFRSLPHDSAVEIRAAVPKGKPAEWVIWHLSSAVSGTAYHVEDCVCPPDGRGCTMLFTSSAPRQPAITLTLSWSPRYFSTTAKMAILIRDFGFAADRTTIDYLSFPEPLTVALLPSRKLAAWTAQISKEYQKEIVVLLPMEPAPRMQESRRSSCIMIHYPEERLRAIIAEAAGSVPHAAGFSNSGGARALEDSRVTGVLFGEIKKRHGYFIETNVTRKSVAEAVARRLSLPFATVACAADSVLQVSRIQDLIGRCALEAQKRGSIIITSKATPAFIRALKNELPLLRRNGVRLSYVSEILMPDK
jgi:polysaccharide deacetylase 2 family uncharacterized protein YibQ